MNRFNCAYRISFDTWNLNQSSNLTIDETSLSQGELYTVVINKAAND